jgi:hypothetical protein
MGVSQVKPEELSLHIDREKCEGTVRTRRFT